jgi:hypothetical protein
MKEPDERSPRTGRLVDGLLIASLVSIVIIVAAYMNMPQVERAAGSLITKVADRWNLD